MLIMLTVVGYIAYLQFFSGDLRSAPIPDKEYGVNSPDGYKQGQDLVNEPWEIDSTLDAQVLIKSVHMQAPLVSLGDEFIRGVKNMALPEPPEATLYSKSAPLGSKTGKTVIASHVDHGQGYRTPFSNMHKIEKGTPVMVKGFDGKIHWYRVKAMSVYLHAAIPEQYFTKAGSNELVLVTCSGPTQFSGEQTYYLYNLVVVAEPLDEKPIDW